MANLREISMDNPISDLAHAFPIATTLAHHNLGDGLGFYAGRLPNEFIWITEQFEQRGSYIQSNAIG